MSHVLRTRKLFAYCLVLIVLFSQAAIARSAPHFSEPGQTVSSSRPFPPAQFVPSQPAVRAAASSLVAAGRG